MNSRHKTFKREMAHEMLKQKKKKKMRVNEQYNPTRAVVAAAQV